MIKLSGMFYAFLFILAVCFLQLLARLGILWVAIAIYFGISIACFFIGEKR